MEKTKNGTRNIKILFILLSIIGVFLSLTGNIITSDKGNLTLLSFESFYVYIVTVIIALYMTLKNKNSNIVLFIALFSYGWTYYLVHQMLVTITDVKMSLGSAFYIYLSSAIFLFISLFFNSSNNSDSNSNSAIQNSTNDLGDNFIFTNFISGIKEIPLNTTILLVNNVTSSSINLIYNLSNNDNDNQTITIPVNSINKIKFDTRVKMQNINKKINDNETKSRLLSAAVFGGNPLIQLVGNNGFDNLFNSLSDNYNKVEYNTYYEIVIDTSLNGQDAKLFFSADINPEKFINKINK